MKTRILTIICFIFFLGLFSSCSEEEINPVNSGGVEEQGVIKTDKSGF